MSQTDKDPIISLVVPVRNSPGLIRECIENIQTSEYPHFELVVVDDQSTDNTADIVEEMGIRLLRLTENVGPARARNQGSQIARGKYLFFIDADVRIYPDTITKVVNYFESHPDVDALFGSYDTVPGAQNILSQYRNMFHHFVHQEGSENATTFWSGCGAIKRDVFLEMGGFDSYYDRPCIEDIELGARLYKAGHKISLVKDVQVTHLKHWSFWGMIRTDVFDRGIPWTELIMRERNLPNDLNLKVTQRISAIFSFGIIGCIGMEALQLRSLFFLPVVLIALLYLLDVWSVKKRIPTVFRYATVLAGLAGIGAIFYYGHIWLMIAVALTVAIIIMNRRFYSFFAREKHWLFAALVVPLHIGYYLYSSFAFVMGILRHHLKSGARPATDLH